MGEDLSLVGDGEVPSVVDIPEEEEVAVDPDAEKTEEEEKPDDLFYMEDILQMQYDGDFPN